MTKMVSSDLFFDISRGVRLKKANRIAGKLPLVTAGYLNEGIAQYISNSQKTFQHAITIDMFGQSFWRPYSFAADDNVVILQKDFLTSDTAFFFLEAIKKTTGFFNYNHQYRLKDLKKHYIELPLLNGEIDWNKIKFISSVLGKITQLNAELTDQLTTELKNRAKQYEYYKNKLLGFKEKS